MSATATWTVWNRKLLRLAGPVILSNLTVPLVGAVDTAVVGHLPGAQHLAGTALGVQLFTYVFWSLGFLSMGTTGLTAQAGGADRPGATRMILLRALLLAFGIGLALAAARGWIAEAAPRWLGGGEAVSARAGDYLRVRALGGPAALANFVILGWLLGCQRAGTGLALQILINGVNTAVSLTLVVGFGWGVPGVATAAVTADLVGCLAGLIIVARLSGATRGWLASIETWAAVADPTAIKRLFAVNRDLFLRTLCLIAAFCWFTHESATMGDVTLGGNAILLTFQTFAAYGLDGVANATEALVGEAIGARDRAGFRMAVALALGWAALIATGCAILYALAGGAIIRGFSDIEAVRAIAVAALPWAALSPVISVWSFLLDGIFIGATRTTDMRNAMLASLAIFLASAWILVPAFGNDGLWAAFLILMVARAGTLAARLPALDRAVG